MKKIKVSLLMMLMFCLCFSFNFNIAKAESTAAKLNDLTQNGVISETDLSEYNQKLDNISQKYQIDISIVFADNLEGKDKQNYADDFYDQNGYGLDSQKSGLLLLVSLGDDDHGWYISTRGLAIDYFNDKSIEYIGGEIKSDLSNKNYTSAMGKYIDLCDQCIDARINGGKFPPHKPLDIKYLGIALIIGLVIALIRVGTNTADLHSVHEQEKANDYLKKNSLNVKNQREIFLYHILNRTERVKDDESSTHVSSSGETHGGGGGDF